MAEAGALPPWARAALLGAAALLVLPALLQGAPPVASGAWRTEALHRGEASPGAPAVHAFSVAVPPDAEGRGFLVDPARAQLHLRGAGPVDAPPFRATLARAGGAAVLDVAVDPANPMFVPHGPPVVQVEPGDFELRVQPLGNASVRYEVYVALTFPYRAEARGLHVDPVLHGVGAALVAAVALVPGPAIMERLRGKPRA